MKQGPLFEKSLRLTAKNRTGIVRLSVISGLGAKPSDLLQANGIIWVEGPSDRIYLNRWIELYSDFKLREGRDYQCVFYGGSLLAHDQITPPEDAELRDFVNLLQVNPNLIVVCDSDRTSGAGEGSQFRPRLTRLKAELESLALDSHHLWITAAKEIENYLPGFVLGEVYCKPGLPDPLEYERFFPSVTGTPKRSYIERHLNRKTVDKVELALESVKHMTHDLMCTRFDYYAQMRKIVDTIQLWNA
jgi:hypothetical protein